MDRALKDCIITAEPPSRAKRSNVEGSAVVFTLLCSNSIALAQ